MGGKMIPRRLAPTAFPTDYEPLEYSSKQLTVLEKNKYTKK